MGNVLDRIDPEKRQVIDRLLGLGYLPPMVASFTMTDLRLTEPLASNGADGAGGTSTVLARPRCPTCGAGLRRRPGVLNFRWRAAEALPGQPAITGYDAAWLNGSEVVFLEEDAAVLEVAAPGFAGGSYTVMVRAVFEDGTYSDWVKTTCVVEADMVNCPLSDHGTITYWVNPIGARADEAGGDGITNHHSCEANQVSQGADGYIRGWGIDLTTKKVGDVFVPDKFSVIFDFEDLFCTDGTYVQKFIVSAGKFSDGSGYIDLPADGFPLMFVWDFRRLAGAPWMAQIWMGKPDGTVVRIDNTYNWKYEEGGDGGTAHTGTTETMDPGFALGSDQHLFDGAERTFYFNFGTSFDVCQVVPPPDPLPNTELWHTAEYAHAWFGPGQLLDPSTDLANFYDSSSTPKWAPKDLGSHGQVPTGTAAQWYFDGDTASFNVNKGDSAFSLATYCVESGLDFAVCVPAVDASTIPASGAYQAVGVRFGINNGSGAAPPDCVVT